MELAQELEYSKYFTSARSKTVFYLDKRLKFWRFPSLSKEPLCKNALTQAQIFAVKKNTENEKTDRMTLIDVGIRG